SVPAGATRLAVPATFAFARLIDPVPSTTTAAADLPAVLAVASSAVERTAQWQGAAPWIFALLVVGFAIRSGTFPFHTWMTSANLEATAPTSVFLTAVQIKLGLYGLLRFVGPLFP